MGRGGRRRERRQEKGEKEDGQEMTTPQRGRCDLVSCTGKCYPASSVSQLPNLQIRQSQEISLVDPGSEVGSRATLCGVDLYRLRAMYAVDGKGRERKIEKGYLDHLLYDQAISGLNSRVGVLQIGSPGWHNVKRESVAGYVRQKWILPSLSNYWTSTPLSRPNADRSDQII